MESTTPLQDFFTRVWEGIEADATAKGQKIPTTHRIEVDGTGGRLYTAHHLKYLLKDHGRGPGKFPPPDAMLAAVQANPDWLARAKQVFKYITEQQLAFLIGRKIARDGTDIYQGKKPGIDLLGVMEANMPDLLKSIAQNEAAKIATSLRSAVKGVAVPVEA